MFSQTPIFLVFIKNKYQSTYDKPTGIHQEMSRILLYHLFEHFYMMPKIIDY